MLGVGRVAIGAALVVAPELASKRWLGDVASKKGTQVAVRALGVRDLLIGLLAVHTIGTPAGPRMLRACALADAVDGIATFAARDELPTDGAWGTIALAGGSAFRHVQVARALARASG
jgi:hypothetical protein